MVLATTSLVSGAQAASAVTYDEKRGPNYSSRVILTFDDCPVNLTDFQRVIKYAKRKNDGHVFAPTGVCIERFRQKYGVDLAKLARSYGQYVINHSVNHPKDLRKLSCEGVARELGRPGVVTNYGRPPYGGIDATVRCGYARVSMKPWLWTGSTGDWMGKSKAEIIAAAARVAKPGATILMHMEDKGFNPDAISKIKAKLEDRGLRLCRAYRGLDNRGAIIGSPVKLPNRLPC
ncbi:polysaccharide deacetylase family protein [Arthrobacter sulfonylureivorans]|uniref:polysaccharide deacetylase family protein n=1 Tax=Arthrobacter sulfonylureivorans TaxID=2486855 RepID=UPI0039E21E29